jgi:hypothetical protein
MDAVKGEGVAHAASRYAAPPEISNCRGRELGRILASSVIRPASSLVDVDLDFVGDVDVCVPAAEAELFAKPNNSTSMTTISRTMATTPPHRRQFRRWSSVRQFVVIAMALP